MDTPPQFAHILRHTAAQQRDESLSETAYLLSNPENARRLLASIERLERADGVRGGLAE